MAAIGKAVVQKIIDQRQECARRGLSIAAPTLNSLIASTYNFKKPNRPWIPLKTIIPYSLI